MNAKQLGEFDLHDAQLLRMSSDYAARTATVEIAYYPNPVNAKRRKKASVVFEGVTKISQVIDLDHLADHANAGNVMSWEPSAKPGQSFIYLVGGVLAVTARSVSVKVQK
jgi:hypothetical protein